LGFVPPVVVNCADGPVPLAGVTDAAPPVQPFATEKTPVYPVSLICTVAVFGFPPVVTTVTALVLAASEPGAGVAVGVAVDAGLAVGLGLAVGVVRYVRSDIRTDVLAHHV
jgi:hypothetical protein